jgi:hypothetical protein
MNNEQTPPDCFAQLRFKLEHIPLILETQTALENGRTNNTYVKAIINELIKPQSTQNETIREVANAVKSMYSIDTSGHFLTTALAKWKQQ